MNNIRNIIQKENILFSFSGVVSQTLIEFIIDITEKKLVSEGESKNIAKKLFLIAIEQLQNIMNHSAKSSDNVDSFDSSQLLIIGYNKKLGKYYVNTSNEIEKSVQNRISEKLDHLNTLTNEERRELLKSKLKSSEDAHSKGAGVGFIEMARRSSEKIEYEFEQINNKLYFNILVYI